MNRRRQMIFSNTNGWKNPYITNGLIGMWDGEWNAGGGIHDSNSMIWKDLSPTKCDLYLTDGVRVDNNFVTADQVTDTGIPTAKSSAKQWYTFDDIITIESVFSLTESTTGYNTGEHMVFSFDGKQTVAYCYRGMFTHTYWKYYAFFSSGTAGLGISKRNNRTAYSWSYSDRTQLSQAYVNGHGVNENRQSGINLRFIGVQFGEKNNNIRYYTTRLYNRTLSEDEIKNNYSIDQTRFNLPPL